MKRKTYNKTHGTKKTFNSQRELHVYRASFLDSFFFEPAKTHETHQHKNFSVPQFESLKRQPKKTPFRRRAQKMGAAKTASESRSKKRSQNSEAFLWMDESIKKKRKCKRGYDEKLGENSTLQTFSLRLPLNHPPASLGWGRIFLLFHFHDDGRGRAARETLEERIASRVMRENLTNAVPIDTVHTGDEGNKKRRNEAFPSLKLQLCETEAANHFLLITASAFSSVIEGKKEPDWCWLLIAWK